MGTITLINGKPVTYLKNNLAADAIYVKSGASFLPAATFSDSTGTALVLPSGALAKPAMLDDSGALNAQVNVRSGTLASLLTLAGGTSEIGVATDIQALVVFNGVTGGARAHFINEVETYEYVDSQTTGATTLSTVSSTWTGLLLDNVVSGRLVNPGIYSGTPGIFVLPAIFPAPGPIGTLQYRVEVSGRVQFSANATGTVRRLRLEANIGAGIWQDMGFLSSGNGFTNLAGGEVITTGVVEGNFVLQGLFDPYAYSQFRIAAAQDSGAAITCKVTGSPLKISIKQY